jgi:hypothetical protein
MNIYPIAILLILDFRIVKYNKKLIKIVLSIQRMNTKIYVKFVSHPTGPIAILVLKLDSLENNKLNQK